MGQVTITYTINPAKPAVIVQTIARTINNDAMRRWLNTGIDSGELGPLLQSLGIQPSLMKMQVNLVTHINRANIPLGPWW